MKIKFLPILAVILSVQGGLFAQTAKKTITNADLEKYRIQREKAEEEYRRNYAKNDMPSPEELEAREAEAKLKRQELSTKFAGERQSRAAYYVEQANLVQSQIVGIDAQINYVRGILGNLPEENSLFVSPGQAVGVGYLPYSGGRFGRRYGYSRGGYQVSNAPNSQAARNAAAGLPNPYAGTAIERSGVKSEIGPNYRYNRGRGYYGYPYYGGYYPYAVNGNPTSSQRDELISRLRMLEQTRAGLIAQWNLLAENARREGVKID